MKKENVSQIILGSILGFSLFLLIVFTAQFLWFFSFPFYLIVSSICLFLSNKYKNYSFLYLSLGISTVVFSLIFASILGNNFEIGGW